MASNLVVTHADCADGFAASWAAHLYFRKHPKEKVEYLHARHGDPPPDVREKHVIIIDFSYSRDIILRMKEEAEELLLLDHHATAQQELEGLDFCEFNMQRSGCGLAWEHFFSGKIPPKLISYTEDSDLWTFNQLKSKEINLVIRSYERDFTTWNYLNSRFETKYGFDQLVLEGEAIKRYQEVQINYILKKSYLANFAGFLVPVVNSSNFMSECGDILSKGHPFAVVWHYEKDGFHYSLRSQKEGGENVGAIAKKFGGGGHYLSAGFNSECNYIYE